MSNPFEAKAFASSLTNHNAEIYRTNANFVYGDAATAPILAILDAKTSYKMVDFGCGSGELTLKLAPTVDSILGIDSSADMLAQAQKLTASQPNITYLPPADLQSFTAPSEHANQFDVVFSSAVFHWCKRDRGGVLEAAKSFLKPGGRLVAEMGGQMNMIGVRGAIHAALRRRGIDPVPLDPWFFPGPAEYTELLIKHGFTPVAVTLHPRPTPLATDLNGWLKTFARSSFLSSFSDEDAQAVMDEVSKECEIDMKGGHDGQWITMYTRLRIDAVLA